MLVNFKCPIINNDILCTSISIHLPSHTDALFPGFGTKSEEPGSEWFLNRVLVYSVHVRVATKHLKESMKCQRGKLRDGPFDIQGGWDFSSRQVIFFSLFCTTSYFFQK